MEQRQCTYQTCVRALDVVARYGGEEFTILLPNTSADAAAKLARRILRAVELYLWRHAGLTVSIGVASWAPH
jgi:diguanylate cyclase (GGDEF)-like protein